VSAHRTDLSIEKRVTCPGGVGAAVGLMCLAIVSCGCSSRPSRIRAVDVDPGALGEAIVEQLDTDANGTLSSSELAPLPPIHDAYAKYDVDGNGEVSLEELEARLTSIFNPQVGLVGAASCVVTRNGRPLPDAEVRFVPPKLLEGLLPPATGVTGRQGVTTLNLAPEDLPSNFPSTRAAVMRPGIYLVEVTHPSIQIPSQYNTKTTLGKEVFGEVLNGPPLPVELKF
jgi:hypothetical protein